MIDIATKVREKFQKTIIKTVKNFQKCQCYKRNFQRSYFKIFTNCKTKNFQFFGFYGTFQKLMFLTGNFMEVD